MSVGILIARRVVPGQPKLREVAGTLRSMVARNEQGIVIGHIDFAAVERANRPLTDIWVHRSGVSSGETTASGHWPEYLGSQAFMFNVEQDAQGRISALVHRQSGYRRERTAVEDAIARRKDLVMNAAARVGATGVTDLRDLVGGPRNPLVLDGDGRTLVRRAVPLQFPALKRR